MTLAAGTRIGPYEIQSPLGAGGMGEIVADTGAIVALIDLLSERYKKLRMGLVDAVVIATAIRVKAAAITTLDLPHFAAVTIPGNPRLLPRDL